MREASGGAADRRADDAAGEVGHLLGVALGDLGLLLEEGVGLVGEMTLDSGMPFADDGVCRPALLGPWLGRVLAGQGEGLFGLLDGTVEAALASPRISCSSRRSRSVEVRSAVWWAVRSSRPTPRLCSIASAWSRSSFWRVVVGSVFLGIT